MILSKQEIANIIRDRPNKVLVTAAQTDAKLLRGHIRGDNKKGQLPIIEGWEDNALHTLRTKYANTNKDLFARLSRPIDKVFTAKGGSVYYNLSGDADKRARSFAADISNGYSVKRWVEQFWKPHFLDDPNGFILVEVLPKPEALKAKAEGRPYTVPTYKSIDTVYDYKPKGTGLEYVVFNQLTPAQLKANGLDESAVVYRVIDDAYDYLVKWEQNEAYILYSLSFPNIFREVPAMLCGDIPHPSTDGLMVSFFNDIIEIANSFLIKGSIKMTHDFLHGFPKYWEYADDCKACGGIGMKNGENCKVCGGSGRSPMTKVSDVKILRHPSTKEDPVITPNVAGYVAPSKDYWEMSGADLKDLENLANFTAWGATSKVQTSGMSANAKGETKTATEVMDEVKPQADRLFVVSEAAEKRHKFILDMAIRAQIAPNYPGASVNYGKRYMLESADIIWTKYSDAKAKKAPVSALDDLYLEYLDAKYSSDPVKLAIMQKLMKVEPFFHFTAMDVKAMEPDPIDYKAKLYFGEWLSTKTEPEILVGVEKELRDDLADYVSTKQLPAPPAPNLLPTA